MKRLRNKPSRRTSRLGVQRLESRQLMAADIGLVDGMVLINGTAQDDVAEVYLESGSVIVQVTTYDQAGQEVGGDAKTYGEAEVDGIVFQAGDGDDLFVNDSNIDSITRSGGGNDTVLGGSGNDIMAMGTGNDIALGGGGDDRILGGPGDNVVISAPADSADAEATSPVNDDTEQLDQESNLDDNLSLNDGSETPAEPESVEDTMLETESDVVVMDPVADDTEMLDIDDPVEEESETEVANLDHVQDDTEQETDDYCATTREEIVAMNEPTDESVDETPVEPTSTNSTAEESTQAEMNLIPSDEIDHGSSDAGSTDQSDELVTDDPVIAVGDQPADDAAADSSDNDVIFGGEGNDVIFGEDGNDLIFGGSSAVDDALLRLVIAGHLSM